MMKKGQLKLLARFLPALEAPNFEAGHIGQPQEVEPGAFSFPAIEYAPVVDEFIKAVYDNGLILRDFDWMSWYGTPEVRHCKAMRMPLITRHPSSLVTYSPRLFERIISPTEHYLGRLGQV